MNIETIRYYERIGLMNKPARTEGGRRAYGEKEAQRLGFIRRSRDLGFSIDDICALLRLADTNGACGDAKAFALAHLNPVRAKLTALKRLERILTETAARCGRAAGGCAIIETLATGGRR